MRRWIRYLVAVRHGTAARCGTLCVLAALATVFGASGCSKAGGEKPSASGETPTASISGGAVVDPKHPTVVVDTSLGRIIVRLDAEKAPLTVENFLSYVDAGHYDQTVFHQVFKGQAIVGGGYGTDMVERPTRTSIRNEADNGLPNARGTISMGRLADVIDSARSQFFFNLADNHALDYRGRDAPESYGYCVFGQVLSGLEVLDRIAQVSVQDRKDLQLDAVPEEPVIVKSIRRTP